MKLKCAVPCGAVMVTRSEVDAWRARHDCGRAAGHKGMHRCVCGTRWLKGKDGVVRARIVYPRNGRARR